MFGFLFNRAQATVDNVIGTAFTRALVATPFLIAAAFAVAALSIRLHRVYVPEVANLILAGVFLLIGLVTAAVVTSRTPQVTVVASDPPAARDEPDAPELQKLGITDEDKELLAAALTSAAPIAFPAIIQMLLRNLPLVLSLVVAVFTFMRLSETAASSASEAPAGNEPGEPGTAGHTARAA